MQAVTILIAIIASTIIFLTRPVWSLVVYCAALAWYPVYLTVPVGTIDFTVPRILIIPIFANILLRTNLINQFKFIWLDKLIIIYFLCQLLAGAANIPLRQFLENRAGAAFDMVLPYFAVRMIITRKEHYFTLLKAVLLIAAPLALVGFYESLTGHNPVGFLRKYFAWNPGLSQPNVRSGFYRASFSCPHPIIFGMFFAMFGPICTGLLYKIRPNKVLYSFGVALMALGVFSCMSSGPFYSVGISILFIAFFPYRKYSKLAITSVILMCFLVEIASNRHFFEVIDRLALNSATAWYRAQLIDVAFFHGGMSGHWLTGYGFADPGWGWRINWLPTDMVNHYLLILSRYGLIGLAPFLAVIWAALKRVIKAYRANRSESDQWLIWCLLGAMVGVLAAMNSVSLFAQSRTIFYIMLAFCGSMPALINQRSPRIRIVEPFINNPASYHLVMPTKSQ